MNTEIERVNNAMVKNTVEKQSETDKFSGLINLMGELVIAGSSLKQVSDKIDVGELNDSVLTVLQLVENVRIKAMELGIAHSIIDGFMVRVGENRYILPLEAMVECSMVNKDTFDLKDGGDYFNIRGEVLPFIRLRDLFKVDGSKTSQEHIVVIEHNEGKAGIIVDELIGEYQAVVKPMGVIFDKHYCINGATILGAGEVALILDIQGILDQINVINSGAS